MSNKILCHPPTVNKKKLTPAQTPHSLDAYLVGTVTHKALLHLAKTCIIPISCSLVVGTPLSLPPIFSPYSCFCNSPFPLPGRSNWLGHLFWSPFWVARAISGSIISIPFIWISFPCRCSVLTPTWLKATVDSSTTRQTILWPYIRRS